MCSYSSVFRSKGFLCEKQLQLSFGPHQLFNPLFNFKGQTIRSMLERHIILIPQIAHFQSLFYNWIFNVWVLLKCLQVNTFSALNSLYLRVNTVWLCFVVSRRSECERVLSASLFNGTLNPCGITPREKYSTTTV